MQIMPVYDPSVLDLYVPYTGATANVDLGAYDFTTTGTLGAGETTLTGNLLFTDDTYDIGADSATRPKALWLSGNATIGGQAAFNGSSISASRGIISVFASSDVSTIGASINHICTRNSGVAANPYVYDLSFAASWKPTLGATADKTLSYLFGGYGSTSLVLDASEIKNFTITNMAPYYSSITLTSAATGQAIVETRAAHYWASAPTINANSVVPELCAFYDAGQDDAQVTTAWGLGINTANSYINGSLSIGKNTAPTVALDVSGATDAGTNCEADAYTVGGVAGADFNGAVTNITVVKGIVTAAS